MLNKMMVAAFGALALVASSPASANGELKPEVINPQAPVCKPGCNHFDPMRAADPRIQFRWVQASVTEVEGCKAFYYLPRDERLSDVCQGKFYDCSHSAVGMTCQRWTAVYVETRVEVVPEVRERIVEREKPEVRERIIERRNTGYWRESTFSLHLSPNNHRWSKSVWPRLGSTQKVCTSWGSHGNKNEKRCCKGGNNRSYNGRAATGDRDRQCWGVRRLFVGS